MASPARETILAIDMSAKLVQWKQAKAMLAEAKEAEGRLRKELLEGLFDPSKDDGTQTLSIGNGWKLKAVKSLDYKAETGTDETAAAMTTLCDAMIALPGGKEMFTELIRFKPDVSVKAYKSALPIWLNTLSAEIRMFIAARISDVITIKPASTQLELIDPNAK